MTPVEIQDAILRHSLELERLAAGNQQLTLAELRALEAELRALITGEPLRAGEKRKIAAMLRAAEEAVQARYVTIAGITDQGGIVAWVTQRTAEAVAGIAQLPVATIERLASLVDTVMIEGAPSAAWWSKQADDTAFRFAAAIRQGVINGETSEAIVARVVGPDGFMEVSKRNARTLVHTSVMTAANDARLAVYKKMGDNVAGVEWLATLDTHTCLRCSVLDGKGWTLDGAAIGHDRPYPGSPPLHFACRCVWTPIPNRAAVDEIFPGYSAAVAANSKRVSDVGPISASEGMTGFINRLTPAQRAEMLGPGRAELWQRGKITLSDLVSGQGQPLTMDQLRARR